MPRLNVTIQVNGRPLRRAYVEQATSWGFVTTAWHLTDNRGRVRDGNGDLGIDSLTSTTDLRIHAANSVVRVLDGKAFNIAVHQDKSGVGDGTTINLNTGAEQADWFEIANRCLLAYELVYRQFEPFRTAADPDFPLGRQRSLRDTYEQARRIEISYPSQMPLAKAAFAEPYAASTGFPMIHIQDEATDRRLFGDDDSRPTLIASELSHGLHFCGFSASQRASIETDYLGWLASDLAAGGDARHAIGKRTSPMVAYLESLDQFGHRFHEYMRRVVQSVTSNTSPPGLPTAPPNDAARRGFVNAELSGNPATGPRVLPRVAVFEPAINGIRGAAPTVIPDGRAIPVGRRRPLQPLFTGGDDEGAVFGAIFVDFANRTSLDTAVSAYLNSARDGVRTFGQYRTWILDNFASDVPELDAAASVWGL